MARATRVSRLGGLVFALSTLVALALGPPASAARRHVTSPARPHVTSTTTHHVASTATPHVAFGAVVGGQPAQLSTDSHPAQISPTRSTPIRITVRNGDRSPLRVATVRLGGQVLGLPLFAYNTSVGLVVPPRATKTLLFFVDMTGAGNQATGLVTGAISILGPDGSPIASHPLVTQVHGDVFSLYGLLGLAVILLTAASLVLALIGLVRHTLPPSRWRRSLRFLIPGFGFGLSLIFLLSASAVLSPTVGHWLPLLLTSTVVGWAVGYLVPAPSEVLVDDYEDDAALARLVVVEKDPLGSAPPTDRVFPSATELGGPFKRPPPPPAPGDPVPETVRGPGHGPRWQSPEHDA